MRGRLSTPSRAGGYSATADAFARDPDTGGLWFLSMVGPQTALKAIWASLLKQPPDTAHLIKGVEGHGALRRIPAVPGPVSHRRNLDHPHRAAARKPGLARAWFTRAWPSSASSGTTSCCLAQDQADAPGLHHRFLDRRSPLPLHRSWRDWLWRRGLDTGEIVPLESAGLLAYTCNPRGEELKADLSAAVAAGTLTLDPEDTNKEEDNDG